ncbi:MAG: hypothetical protein ACREBP_10830 [Sphingomicrobium sp.]
MPRRFGVNLPALSNLPADIARSNGQPMSSRQVSACLVMPSRSAHSAAVLRSPLNAMTRVVRRFRLCSLGVAHMQLALQYGPSLSMRSSDIASGGRPISVMKTLKDAHLGS